jgi:hypothetical protein
MMTTQRVAFQKTERGQVQSGGERERTLQTSGLVGGGGGLQQLMSAAALLQLCGAVRRAADEATAQSASSTVIPIWSNFSVVF